MIRRAVAAALVALAVLATLAGCSTSASAHLTLRLWDPQVAKAYRVSLATFERHTGISVDVIVVPYADYFTQLRADVAARTVDDVFWTNATNFRPYASVGAIRAVSPAQLASQSPSWSSSVVSQYTADGKVWGVPQITDPGIGLVYNAKLLAAAGLTPDDVHALTWDPAAADDSLRSVARALTTDSAGRHPGDSDFDATRISEYGFGAADDLNAVVLQFLAGNGASWQTGDRFTFASPAGIRALSYVVDLIDRDHVAPPASDTNAPAGGDFLLNQFTQGKLALFPTGAYNLANIAEGAGFPWGVAPLPAGPAGAISVTNGVILAASASTDHRQAQRELLYWLGSAAGQRAIGESGSALPANSGAQDAYLAYWSRHAVDISPMLDVLRNGTIQAPQGAHYSAAAAAMAPILDDVFLGRRTPAAGIRAAQDAANQAIATAP
jgi:multiple sugar transport system substrate-binding protein